MHGITGTSLSNEKSWILITNLFVKLSFAYRGRFGLLIFSAGGPRNSSFQEERAKPHP
jgi:hypothetical protein